MTFNKGVLYGAGAYLIWGFFPVYFKAIQDVPPVQIILHRVVWSFILLGIVISLRKDWSRVRKAASNPRVLVLLVFAALLLAMNWLLYVWGVNTGHVVETSLGYFINPLLSVALGVVVLREKLRPLQWLPVGLAAAGVLYLTVQFGALPWIALGLAFSFGSYGLIKKVAPLAALYGLTLETAILFLPALGCLLFLEARGSGAFGHIGWSETLLLIGSGLATSLPLLLFASAARSIPLSMVGLLQYIAPTVQFLLGVFLFKEPFSHIQLIGFGMIWVALLIFTLEGLNTRRKLAVYSVS